MEDDITIQSASPITIDSAHLTVNKNDQSKKFYNYNFRPKACYDKETPFFDKIKATLADGAWETLESTPGIIANILIQATTAILVQKTNAWLNESSEGPSSEDKATLKAIERHQVEFLKLQLALKENKQALAKCLIPTWQILFYVMRCNHDIT